MIFGGCAGIGKSYFLISMARALALGETPFNYPKFHVDRPVRVLFIEHELKPYGLQKRLKPIFKDVDTNRLRDQFFYVSGEPGIQFSSFEGYEALKRVVREIQPEVLILDPIGKMHYENENDNGALSKICHKIDLLLKDGESWGMSVVFSHHFGKPAAVIRENDSVRDALDPYNFRGGSKWKDDPDVRVTMLEGLRLNTVHKSWYVDTRFLTRQGAGYPDLRFAINEFEDERVYFVKELNAPTGVGGTPKAKVAPVGEKKIPAEPDKPHTEAEVVTAPIVPDSSSSEEKTLVMPGDSAIKTVRPLFTPARKIPWKG